MNAVAKHQTRTADAAVCAIRDAAHGEVPFNENLLESRNFDRIEELL